MFVCVWFVFMFVCVRVCVCVVCRRGPYGECDCAFEGEQEGMYVCVYMGGWVIVLEIVFVFVCVVRVRFVLCVVCFRVFLRLFGRRPPP